MRSGLDAASEVTAARWLGILDRVPHPIVLLQALVGADGQVVDFTVQQLNLAACRDRGWSRDRVLGRALGQLVSFESGFLQIARDALSGTGSVDRRIAGLDLQAEREGEGGVVLSWQRTVDARLQWVSSQLRAVYDAMDDGLVVFDGAGQVILVNDAEARLVGYSSADEMKRNLAYFSQVFELHELDGTPLPVANWPVSRVLRGERVQGVELRTRRRDTGQEWIVSFSGRPVHDEAGQLIMAVVISSDVTERTRRTQQLHATEKRFRSLADSMPQLVWTANSDGVVDYYNAQTRAYDGVAQLPDGTWRWQAILHPDDLSSTEQAWHRAVADGTDYQAEHRVRMADGSFRWHISRARRVPENGGVRWYGTATDIHEQKLVQEELHQAMATREQVVGVVAHDLRTPLSVVRTSVPLLRRVITAMPPGESRARGESYLSRMDRQVTTMEKILDDLLDVARLQAGQPLDLDRRDCDLVALVRALVDEQAGNGAITLQAPMPSLMGVWDAGRLERVIGNLLSNALKYSPGGRDIVVAVQQEGDDAVVRVSDRGVGIPEQDRARIFDWFARGENAERTARGTGIGLAGARQIVQQHGGTLTVESQLGVGSTFTVRLPLGRGHEDRPTSPGQETARP